MENITRVEQLLPGQIGQLFIYISMFSALIACIGYYFAAKKEYTLDAKSWLNLGRGSFVLHALSIFTVFGTLYYIISSHLFEFYYAWRHTSLGLSPKYLFASFWEGGEGSFLLWMFWHAIIGLVLLFKAKEWESRTMFVISLVQFLLTTFILGVYITPDIRIGSSPFVLLKHEMDAPIFATQDYLSKIKDGNGLNVLLQNYWMVIHPPVLFLGFALSMVPFAYTVAALWKGEYKTWIKPMLRWLLAAAGILGLGIMMGGAWAYESLNFGGYWAWDPVENASLVPWIILLSGLHTLLIYKSTNRSLKATFIFNILAFVLVWYSTFLTRTGVLGDTSVHSFTGEGKSLYWHLILVIAVFLALPIIYLVKRWKKLPKVAGEEEVSSREFWLLIGSIFMLLAALQISFTTSIPVWAPAYKYFTGIDIAPPTDVVTFYNNIQVWAAFIILILTGAVQILKYKKTPKGEALKAIITIAIISVVLSTALVYFQEITQLRYICFSFAVVYALVANAYYLVFSQKFALKKAGGSITHLGFAIMMLGVLISGYNKRVISLDRSNTIKFERESFEEALKESRENVIIFRNTQIPMGDYMVTYLGDTTLSESPKLKAFKVRYDKRNSETNELEYSFYLYPEVFEKELSANPASKHYFNKDVFTYITSYLPPEQAKTNDSIHYSSYNLKKGDTIYVANGYLVYEDIIGKPTLNKNVTPKAGVNYAEIHLTAHNLDEKMGTIAPVYVVDTNDIYSVPDTFRDLGLYVRINKINPETEIVEFGMHQVGQADDYIVMKAIIFPWINLVWTGIIVMTLGFFVTMIYRRK